MRYRILTAIALIWTAAFLQSTVLEHLEVFSIRPNLLLVLMVVISLLRPTSESAGMSLALGLTMDMLMGKTLGWYALLFFLVSIPISLINQKLYREKLLVLLSFGFVSTVVIETVFFLIMFLFKGYEYLPFIFTTVVLPEALLNSILILPLFKPIAGVYIKLDKVDRRRNRIAS
jgi:rod shape-determining protein MreD